MQNNQYDDPERKTMLQGPQQTIYPEYSRTTFETVSFALKNLSDTGESFRFGNKNLIANIDTLKQLTASADVHVHYMDENNKRILSNISDIYFSSEDDIYQQLPTLEKEHIAEAVAKRKEQIVINSICSITEIFPQGVETSNEFATNIVCIPIMNTKKDRCYIVIELIRENDKPYNKSELKIIQTATQWIGISLVQVEVKQNEERIYNLNMKLRNFVDDYFLEKVDYHEFLSNIVIFAKNVIDAERAFVYKIHSRLNTYPVYADLFEDKMTSRGQKMIKISQKFKINREKGLASHVVKTAEPFNLTASKENTLKLDAEFLKLLNVQLKTCICQPILYNGIVIAIVQLFNKRNDESFTSSDQVVLDKICVYLSLVQHFEKIKELCDFEYAKSKIIRNELGFHLKTLATVPIYTKFTDDDLPDGFNDYGWYPEFNQEMAVPWCFYMFKKICPDIPNEDNLYEFYIDLKKCTRPLPYRNFMHTFDVMHTTYCIIRDVADELTKMEKYALMLAASCQCVNVEGFNSHYYSVTKNPYALVYDAPYFRNFQASFAKRMINVYKILSNFSEDEENRILKMFNNCIVNLNTAHGEALVEKLKKILQDKKLENKNPQHRLYKVTLISRASCKARIAKSFRIGKKLCEDIYRELFIQSDIYKSMEINVPPWLDRANVHMIPEHEVEYIRKICLPIYELLKKIFPQTAPLYNLCRELQNAWSIMIELRYKKSWNPDESLGKSLEEATK